MDGLYHLMIQTFDANGQAAQNTTVWDLSGTNPAVTPYDTAIDFLINVHTTLIPLMRAYMSNTAIVDYMTARKFDTPPGPYAQFNVRQPGTITTPGTNFVEAADIKLKPGGRRNRSGHWFATGMPQASFTGGRLIVGQRTALSNFATTLIAPLTLGAGTAELVTYSRAIKPPKPPMPAFTTRVTDWEVAQKATGLNKRTLPLI